jgi:hypothetical protein
MAPSLRPGEADVPEGAARSAESAFDERATLEMAHFLNWVHTILTNRACPQASGCLEFTHFLNAKVHFTPINKG